MGKKETPVAEVVTTDENKVGNGIAKENAEVKKRGRPRKIVEPVEPVVKPVAVKPVVKVAAKPAKPVKPVKPVAEKVAKVKPPIVAVEPDKMFIAFPQTDLEVEAKRIVDEFEIDCPKLPIEILEKINALNTVFKQFVEQPYNVVLIPSIREADVIASKLLNEWVELQKLPSKKEKHSTVDGRLVMTKEALADGVDKALPTNPTSQESNPIINTSSKPALAEFLTPNRTLGNGNPPVNDGLVSAINQTPNFILQYAAGVYEHICSCFQFHSWGYVPVSIVQSVLASCDKAYTYEFIQQDGLGFVKVTSAEGTSVETNRFKVG